MPHRQPLDRDHVTQGSRLVLRAYPAAFTALGLVFLFQGSARTDGPAFASAKWLLGWTPDAMTTWALVFLLLGLFEELAWQLGRRGLFKWLLVVGAGVCGCWAFLLLCSAAVDPFVSFTGAIWVGFAAIAHMASVRSLARDLVIR